MLEKGGKGNFLKIVNFYLLPLYVPKLTLCKKAKLPHNFRQNPKRLESFWNLIHALGGKLPKSVLLRLWRSVDSRYWYSLFTPFLPGVKLPKCCVSVSIFRTNCLEENRSEVEGQKKWALDKSLLETSKTIFPFQLSLKWIKFANFDITSKELDNRYLF